MRNLILCMILFGLCIMPMAEASIGLSVSSTTAGDALLPGSESYIVLTIKNEGTSDISNLYVTLKEFDAPLAIEGLGGSRYLRDLSASGTLESIYKVTVPDNTPAGTYLARFEITENTGTSEKMIAVHNAVIEVQGSSSLVIDSVTPTSLSPGQEAVLSLTLKNNGNDKLTNIELSWSASGDVVLPLKKDQKIYISALPSNEEAEISMPIIAKSNVVPDVYPMTFNASYYAAGVRKTSKSIVGIVIGGETDLGVSAKEGSTGSLDVTVANIGTNPAYSVSVKLGLSESFIGNIEAGEYSVASLAVKGPSDLLKVQVSYTDTLGERHTLEKEVSLIGAGTDLGVSVQQTSTGALAVTVANIGTNPAYSVSVKIGPSESFIGNIEAGEYSIASLAVASPTNQTRQPGNFSASRTRQQGGVKVQVSYTDTLGERHTLEKEVPLVQTSQSIQRETGAASESRGSSSTRYIVGGAVLAAAAYLFRKRKRAKA